MNATTGVRRGCRLAVLFAAAWLGAGCDADAGTGAGVTACAPLTGRPAAPTMLGNVRGIGRHADGTLYVLDEATRVGPRAFVSNGGAVLARKTVTGSGQGIDASGSWYVVSVLEPAAPFTLKVDGVGGGGAVRMGVIRGAFAGRDFVIGQSGDVLDVQGADAVAGMTVLDIPLGVYVEYVAHVPDGRELVVMRPDHDWSYQDFRLFLGAGDQLVERRVTSVVRAKDGGTTTIEFVLDGASATAFFPAPPLSPTGGGVPAAPATLSVGGDTLPLVTEPAGTSPPASTSFVCL